MCAKRLTRAESKARTRDRLLEAAASVFARQGLAGASVEAVAEEAGFTRGAVYSNFESKEDLFLALLDARTGEQVRTLEEVFARSTTPDGRVAALRVAYAGLGEDREWNLLLTELMLAAARNAALRAKLVALYRGHHTAIARLVARLGDDLGGALPLPAESLATALIGAYVGLALQRLIDPAAAPSDLFGDAFTLLLRGDVTTLGSDEPTPK